MRNNPDNTVFYLKFGVIPGNKTVWTINIC